MPGGGGPVGKDAEQSQRNMLLLGGGAAAAIGAWYFMKSSPVRLQVYPFPQVQVRSLRRVQRLVRGEMILLESDSPEWLRTWAAEAGLPRSLPDVSTDSVHIARRRLARNTNTSRRESSRTPARPNERLLFLQLSQPCTYLPLVWSTPTNTLRGLSSLSSPVKTFRSSSHVSRSGTTLSRTEPPNDRQAWSGTTRSDSHSDAIDNPRAFRVARRLSRSGALPSMLTFRAEMSKSRPTSPFTACSEISPPSPLVLLFSFALLLDFSSKCPLLPPPCSAPLLPPLRSSARPLRAALSLRPPPSGLLTPPIRRRGSRVSVKIWERSKPRTRWCRSLWQSERRALGECGRSGSEHVDSSDRKLHGNLSNLTLLASLALSYSYIVYAQMVSHKRSGDPDLPRFLRHFVQLQPGQAEDSDACRTFSCVQSAGQADRKAQVEAPKSGNDGPVVSFPSLFFILLSEALARDLSSLLGAWQFASESYVACGPSQGIDIELVPGSRRRTQEIDEGLSRSDLHARPCVYTYVTSSFSYCPRAA